MDEAIPDCTERICLVVYLHVVSLIAAKAYFFCLDTKETKNQVIRNASLLHRAIPCKSDKTWAAAFLPRYRPLLPLASVKSRYALPLRTRPPSFCLFSPQAVLPTAEEASPNPLQRKGL
jgi:hypothetical protein